MTIEMFIGRTEKEGREEGRKGGKKKAGRLILIILFCNSVWSERRAPVLEIQPSNLEK
jgi:hypothetical protein